MKRRGRPPHPDILTPREWEVLELLRTGLSNPEIAERLGVTRDAVKYHVSEILSKLGVVSREEAAAWRAYERPWWAAGLVVLGGVARRLSPLGRIAAIGASIVALAGVALLAWGVWATGGSGESDEDAPAQPSGSAGPAPVAQVLPLGKIAFAREGDVWIKDLDSGEERLLLDDGAASRPKWSSGGDWLAYVTGPVDSGYSDLRVVSSGPGGTSAFEARVNDWAWSPVDSRLAYVAAEDNSL